MGYLGSVSLNCTTTFDDELNLKGDRSKRLVCGS